MTEDHGQEAVPWCVMEFGCWTMAVLFPILSRCYGLAFSGDEAVMRGLVFALAWAGGIATTAV